MSADVLVAIAVAAAMLLFARFLSRMFFWRLHVRQIERRRHRRKGDLTEALRREIRFFDDGWNP